jgi:hypothetical protein
MNHELLSDRWHNFDFPLLLEVAKRVNQREEFISARDIANALNQDSDEVIAALESMAKPGGWVEGKALRGDSRTIHFVVEDLTERGRRATGLWPDGENAVEQLLSALRQAEELTNDPDDKTALRKAAGQLATVSRSVLAEVIAAVVTRQAGIS